MDPFNQPPDIPLRHSGFGIASFVLAVVSGTGEFVTVLAAGLIEATAPGCMKPDAPVAILIGLLILGAAGLNVLGLILGIVGACQADRRRLFAGLGLACNGLLILGIAAMIIIGSLVG